MLTARTAAPANRTAPIAPLNQVNDDVRMDEKQKKLGTYFKRS